MGFASTDLANRTRKASTRVRRGGMCTRRVIGVPVGPEAGRELRGERTPLAAGRWMALKIQEKHVTVGDRTLVSAWF